MKKYATRGITLIEMMIVIAILSILIAVAVPNFNNLIVSNQISGNLEDFVGALRRAKSESSARLTPVTVCMRNGNACSVADGATWGNGWLVFLDNNGDGNRDIGVGGGETILYQQEALGRQITFRGTGNAASRIIFSPSGNTNLTSGEIFAMCDQSQSIRRGIHITVAGHSSLLNDNNNIQREDC